MGLSELLARYHAVHPHRATGGLHAISGFNYQLRGYLADFVSALARGDVLDEGMAFAYALEALSDYTAHTEGATILVQAKLGLTAATARTAALEFAVIDGFLENADPALWRSVGYEVVASRCEWAVDWSTVTLPARALAAEPGLQDRFQALVEAGRVLPPRIEPDPWWRLISAAYPHLADPFAFARRALDRCLDRGPDTSAAVVRNAIAEDFARNRRDAGVGRVVQPEQFATADTGGNTVVIAETPTLRHLAEGRFMARPRSLDSALAALQELLAGRGEGNDGKVDVFWINGRSGCGKSVFLLQLVRALVCERAGRAIWLGGAAAELFELFSTWSGALAEAGDEVYVAIDDMYDPQSRDDLQLSRLITRVLHSPATAWPVIITTGPPEFRDSFERDSRAEAFRIHDWQLPLMDREETSRLHEWFTDRTGRASRHGPASEQDEALIMSVMAEMYHGDLRPLAHRFRARLEQYGLVGPLRVPLALNRLYIWSPGEWLTPEQQASLDLINRAGDFSLIFPETHARRYLKLTHPHLSDSIYQSLHDGPSPRAYARDVANAFDWALRRDPALAIRILYAIARNSERIQMLDPRELAEACCRAWTDHGERVASFAPEDLARLWTSWSRWNTREPRISLLLGTSPLDRAIELLEPGDPHWVSLWHQLWECAPGHAMLQERAGRWLEESQQLRGWGAVWSALVEHRVEAGEDLSGVLALGYRALAGNPDSTSSSYVLRALLTHRGVPVEGESVTDLIVRGRQWLLRNPSHGGWSYVWVDLRRVPDDELSRAGVNDARALARAWLASEWRNPGWGYVWGEMLRTAPSPAARDKLVALGQEWLEQVDGHRSRVMVQLELARAGFDSAPAASRAAIRDVLEWLERRPDAAEWSGVYFGTMLLPDFVLGREAQERLLACGIAWLRTHEGSPAWPHVFARVLAKLEHGLAAVHVAAMLRLGMQWLEHGETERRYGLIWRTMLQVCQRLELAPQAQDLVRLGRRFVSDVAGGSERGWDKVWFGLARVLTPMAKGEPDDVELLRESGFRWLATPGRMTAGIWTQVFLAVARLGPVSDALLQMGAEQVVSHTHKTSPRLASHLLEWGAPDRVPRELIEWVAEWLHQAETADGFAILYHLNRTLRRVPDHAEAWASLRHVLREPRNREPLELWERFVATRRVGDRVNGKVVKTVKKKPKQGFLIDLGIGINAFMRMEEAGPGAEYLIGHAGEFEITTIDEVRCRVDVSLKRVRASTMQGLAPGDRVRARVQGRVHYGVFLRAGEMVGLLHKSSIPPDCPTTAFAVGNELDLVVRRIDVSANRIEFAFPD